MFFKKMIRSAASSNLVAAASVLTAAYTFECKFGNFIEKRKVDYENPWLSKGYTKVHVANIETFDLVGPLTEPVYVWRKPDSQEQPYEVSRKNSPT